MVTTAILLTAAFLVFQTEDATGENTLLTQPAPFGETFIYATNNPIIPKICDFSDIHLLISCFGDYYGLSYTKALRVANCESGLRSTAQNSISSAGGIYQFIDSTWESTKIRMEEPDLVKYNAYDNIKAGLWLASNDGWRHWVCK